MAVRDLTQHNTKFMTHDPRFDEANQPRPRDPDPPRKVKIEGKEHMIPAEAKIEQVIVHVGDKEMHPINLQIGPTRGYIFAVFSHNPNYHNVSLADWHNMARNAIDRWCAQNGKRLESARVEFMAPYNFMGEYR